ncbi:dihydrodipicolinate synthase family protein [Halarchaeum nitratireducens]|uniref:4-hydroxy-tetrahydrodipicolinate synthase 1 n=1 Tax=Halarchaeum nitratireducens TaxID=489913 RepID=A0A830G9J8_9EURY|nr:MULTISPECIES: dihydrodipicolinate synthase family protein [Halarchaeum]MBP2251562.1 4-hydroxy-tetrahydrodipicolinate synthase [Halarchaeum solikamskense]GGN14035.1 4-hydroxy-tetrahydrodipicolinate synthase 1 [Halarchaeum nitratireducens]
MRETDVFCPLVTPMDAEGEIDYDGLESVVRSVRDAGLDGFVPSGTTGEFASLTREENRAVVERVRAVAGDDATVIAGAGATSVPDTVSALTDAAESGADAGLVVVPYFHTANAADGNARFLRRVADRSPLPLYLYNIPACTGSEIPVETVVELADRDDVHGLKDSSGDFGYVTDVLAAAPDDFAVYQGVDDQLVPAGLMGATGGINALSNAVPEVFAAVRDALNAGDDERARELHRGGLKPLFSFCADHGFAPATKAALAARGRIDEDAVRPPLVELDEGARAAIAAAVDDALTLVS